MSRQGDSSLQPRWITPDAEVVGRIRDTLQEQQEAAQRLQADIENLRRTLPASAAPSAQTASSTTVASTSPSVSSPSVSSPSATVAASESSSTSADASPQPQRTDGATAFGPHSTSGTTRRANGFRGSPAGKPAVIVSVAAALTLLTLALVSRGTGDDDVTVTSAPLVSATADTSASATTKSPQSEQTPGVSTSSGTSSTPSGGASRSASGEPSASVSTAPTPVSRRPIAWSGKQVLVPPGVPSGGPGVSTPGAVVLVSIDPSHTFVTVHESFRATSSLRSLRLAAPRYPLGAKARIDDLQVTLDGVPVAVNGRQGEGWLVDTQGLTFRRVSVSYRLNGAIVGRAQQEPRIPVVPLTLPQVRAQQKPLVLMTRDRAVLSVTCVNGAVGCGNSVDSGRRVTRIAQLPHQGVYGIPVLTLVQGF